MGIVLNAQLNSLSENIISICVILLMFGGNVLYVFKYKIQVFGYNNRVINSVTNKRITHHKESGSSASINK